MHSDAQQQDKSTATAKPKIAAKRLVKNISRITYASTTTTVSETIQEIVRASSAHATATLVEILALKIDAKEMSALYKKWLSVLNHASFRPVPTIALLKKDDAEKIEKLCQSLRFDPVKPVQTNAMIIDAKRIKDKMTTATMQQLLQNLQFNKHKMFAFSMYLISFLDCLHFTSNMFIGKWESITIADIHLENDDCNLLSSYWGSCEQDNPKTIKKYVEESITTAFLIRLVNSLANFSDITTEHLVVYPRLKKTQYASLSRFVFNNTNVHVWNVLQYAMQRVVKSLWLAELKRRDPNTDKSRFPDEGEN